MTRIKCLTEALLADGQREPSAHNIVAGCVCGHTFVYRGRQGELNGNFCSNRCQAWYDAGNAPVAAEIVDRWRNGKPMQRSANGFKILCAHCRKDFESKGLRCCSPQCERALREREQKPNCPCRGQYRAQGQTSLRGLSCGYPHMAQRAACIQVCPLLLR